MLTSCTLLLTLLLCSSPASSSPLMKEESVCARTECGAGRECVPNNRGESVCRCLQRCGVRENWVCGSNGKSYRNHCELHREACLTQTKIHTVHQGHCQENPTKRDVSPIVCFLSDRDWLRQRVIQWIQEEVKSDSPASNVSSANELLHMYFKTYDNGDSELDSKEFLSFLKHNETALHLTYSKNLETNALLRSLCVDALIELSDENADWKLSLQEFVNCLTPTYHPYERKCALEDEVFEDGAETQMECNKCVCACGNWVCTALACSGEHHSQELAGEGGEEKEMTEEEWSRRVAELKALQENFALET
eukprot:XP_011601365.1 PREDICTED: follistatin-related protein 1-like [Takifugu rubripes]